MTQLLIPDVDEVLFLELKKRASNHGRSAEAEAKAILKEALQPGTASVWAEVDAIFNRMSASGRNFSDSGELQREDRDR
jgi:plasmid stability protein